MTCGARDTYGGRGGGGETNSYKVTVGTPECRRPLGTQKRRLDIMKMDVT